MNCEKSFVTGFGIGDIVIVARSGGTRLNLNYADYHMGYAYRVRVIR